jgi:hypothetical protein
MLSAQLESSPTSKVVRTRPSHDKPIDPFIQTSAMPRFLSRHVTFRALPRLYTARTREDGIVSCKQNNSHNK